MIDSRSGRIVGISATALIIVLVLFWSMSSSPFPLRSEQKSSHARPIHPVEGTASADHPTASGTFNEMKFSFQDDLKYKNPGLDIERFMKWKPHNYQGPGKPTFALYLSSRNGTLHDPYFQAAQQMVYRILWDPRSKSKKHPLTVFVAPFIAEEQRNLLAAAGAMVRELELVEWHPTVDNIWARWRDLFSKLNIWSQTDFSRVAFLDLDAFPLQPIDDIFNVAKPQKCKKKLLPIEDKPYASEICNYVFTGAEIGSSGSINVGVMVLEPNKAMHRRLIREASHTENFDNSMAEQAFLNYAFKRDGPFPTELISREWNGFFPQQDEEGKLKIIHEKLWSMENHWAATYFNETWQDMLKLYESEDFAKMREGDGLKSQT